MQHKWRVVAVKNDTQQLKIRGNHHYFGSDAHGGLSDHKKSIVDDNQQKNPFRCKLRKSRPHTKPKNTAPTAGFVDPSIATGISRAADAARSHFETRKSFFAFTYFRINNELKFPITTQQSDTKPDHFACHQFNIFEIQPLSNHSTHAATISKILQASNLNSSKYYSGSTSRQRVDTF